MLEEALSAPGPVTAVAADRLSATLLVKLAPGESRGELRHGRSDTVVQILRGRGEFSFADVALAAPEVILIPAGKRFALKSVGHDALVALLVLVPGVSRLDEKPLGAVSCPFCTAEIAVEPGDQPGDRFVCPDCGGTTTYATR